MYAKMFNRMDMNNNLKELSKELKREFGRNSKHEIVVVGGAAIVLKHDFRESSSDIDAIVSDGSSIKDAVRRRRTVLACQRTGLIQILSNHHLIPVN